MRQRQSIRELEKGYLAGDKKPLEDLIRAWKGVQSLPPDDLNSFFTIAGYHGEPFRGAGWGNPQWWGGYCNHGNVLFPTWHRAYILRLEDALRSIPGCENVAMPYWDETDEETAEKGVPDIFLAKQFELDGTWINNPLYSYTFQAGVYDNVTTDPEIDYTKPPGYVTVRYPFSGLVGLQDAATTQKHNEQMMALGQEACNKLLNENVQSWLGFSFTLSDGNIVYTGTREKYQRCLLAPNYTVFSNTTSATQWNEDHFGVMRWQEEGAPPNPTMSSEAIVPLESPHNDIHLSIGGFEYPGTGAASGNFDHIADANGDMGENDTAAFDPIFYFHHCFIDKVFWDWQVQWGKTKAGTIDVIKGYPGTNSIDSQGPTPGVPGNVWLGMDSPLDPFVKDGRAMTSNDLVDIENQCSYTYIQPRHKPLLKAPSPTTGVIPHVKISGINRGAIAGSFAISTWVTVDCKKQLAGVKSVLSRWHVSGCANCHNHLDTKVVVPLYGLTEEQSKTAKVEVKVHTRGEQAQKGGLKGGKPIHPKVQLGSLFRHHH